MTDYSSVAPPTSNAFADALQRARQIAAKINTPNGSSSLPVGGGTKRPVDDSPVDWEEQSVPKKRPTMNEPMGGPPTMGSGMPPQHRLGVPDNLMVTEELKIPNKMVGLIIGTGGEQIMGLQAVCNCKIQMEPAPGYYGFCLAGAGQAERTCTLTGGQVAINKAKEMIMDIVNRSGSFPDRSSTVEMSIPAMKVGLIIGKGGETIKSLQERAGVKMVLVQDGLNSPEKTLSIKGDPQKAEYARQLILDMLTERELSSDGGSRGFGGGGRGRGQTNGYGSMQTTTTEIGVPVQAVGVVIGKGGEMIKKIQQDSGARLQFQQEDGPGERMCLLTGTQDQIQEAQNIIHELITSVLQRDQQNMGRGRGRGRPMGFDDRRGGPGGPGGGAGNGMPGRGGPGGGGPGGSMQGQVTFTVPANKCGIVIGKGGETIRNINQVTGAHVQLSREPPPSEEEKVFVIRGMPEQIEHAKQLINEKVGGGGGSGGPSSGYGHQSMGYGQGGHQGSSDPHGYQQWQTQGQSNTDASKQVADAWTAYYAQYYNQNQQAGQPSAGQPAPPQQAAQASGQAGASAAGGVQHDYSAAWAEYYRSMGMFREAEMIEQQAKQGGTPGSAAAAQPASQTGQGGAPPGGQQQQQYDQYGQYDQGGAYSYNYGAYPSQQQ